MTPFLEEIIRKLIKDPDWRKLGPRFAMGCLSFGIFALIMLFIIIMMIIEKGGA